MKPAVLAAFVERKCELAFGGECSDVVSEVLQRADTQAVLLDFINGASPCVLCCLRYDTVDGPRRDEEEHVTYRCVAF